MSSSPKLARVQAFEYHDPGSVKPPPPRAAGPMEDRADLQMVVTRLKNWNCNWLPLAPKGFARGYNKPNNRSRKNWPTNARR